MIHTHTHKNTNTCNANQIKTKYPQDKTRPSTPNINTKPGNPTHNEIFRYKQSKQKLKRKGHESTE